MIPTLAVPLPSPDTNQETRPDQDYIGSAAMSGTVFESFTLLPSKVLVGPGGNRCNASKVLQQILHLLVGYLIRVHVTSAFPRLQHRIPCSVRLRLLHISDAAFEVVVKLSLSAV